eukprot:SM000115S23928  [mRNA]  locus=s115:266152:270285:- [translate_table: standard]
MGASPAAETAAVVDVAYADLLDDSHDLTETIEAAYGLDGLGILTVSGVPSYSSLRMSLLQLTQQIAALPEDVKAKLEDAGSKCYILPTTHYEVVLHFHRYSFGWSHGKETLGSSPDLLKGSYYANPLVDVPTRDADLIQRYPSYCRPNIWPSKSLPDFEAAFKKLGKLIVDVGCLLARHCDRYAYRWIGWKGYCGDQSLIKLAACTIFLLMCLTAAIFSNDGRELQNPDPCCGLYVENRRKEIVKVSIPADSIAFQMGESMQIHSGGLLWATPHCVKAAQGVRASKLSRSTFAVFMQKLLSRSTGDNLFLGNESYRRDEPMDLPLESTPANVGVSRWVPGLDFGAFAELTTDQYYS